MPIYEFYCEGCHTVFQFFSRTIDTQKRPSCPKCKRPNLKREVSLFAMTGKAKEPQEGAEDLPFDEEKMEQAMMTLASEAESIDENDPRQAANLMRKLSDMTGLELGDAMQEALRRMEAGEDPEAIEAEMGDRLEEEDPFCMPSKAKTVARRLRPPHRDTTIYDL